VQSPNLLFRQARERLPSPSRPGECMSRSELAKIANEELYPPERRRFSPVNANYVGKLERGEIRWPQPRYQDAFRKALQVGPEADIGFIDPERMAPVRAESVDRRGLLMGAGVTAGLALFGEPTLSLLAPVADELPLRVGRDHIAYVHEVANIFRHLDNSRGGGVARKLADQHLCSLARLLTVNCPGALRPALHTAVAQLAGVVGFMLFDAYDHENARRRFTFALQCAEIGGNWHQRALLLTAMARQAIWCELPDEGLTYIEMGLVRADRLTNTERAMLNTVRARALAKFGPRRAQEALAAVGAADEAFADSEPSEDPAWMRFYDDAQHNGDTAHALFDVAVSTDLATEAITRFGYSVNHHGPEYARSRAISRTKLATLVMKQGDPREAAAIGQQALDDAGSVHSRRAADDLRALSRVATTHATIEEVQLLRTRVDKTIEATQ
jgi:hypothetical protein